MSFVQHLLFDSSIPIEERQKALERAFSDPGVPDSTRTTSPFWLEHPHPLLAKIQSPTLPSEVDIVIIGSGITSTSIARTFLESRQSSSRRNFKRPSIAILEARDICSGATGRNGGHILDTEEDFADMVQTFGMEAAKNIARLRLSHLDELMQVAEQYGLTEESQARRVQFLSTYFEEDRWQKAVESIELFKANMPEESTAWDMIRDHDVHNELCHSHAVGIITGPAGAIWPYKFVTGLLAHLYDQYRDNLKIETNTPVTAIHLNHNYNESNGGGRSYEVITPRGKIKCKHVVHCTNAHAAHLVPGLRGRIYPIRGQMSAQTPGNKFRPQGNQHSWLFNYQVGFDYLTQLPSGPNSGNEMMLGGGFAQGEYGGLADLGVATDDEMSLYTDIHLSGVLSAVFGRENWGTTTAGPSVKSMWTGNMGFSADGLPWVGRLPDSCTRRDTLVRGSEVDERRNGEGEGNGGEWICAAFSGEGMVHAWRCGIALANMILQQYDKDSSSGGDNDDDNEEQIDLSWFPEQMLVTEKRIKESVLPRKLTSNVVTEELEMEDWICLSTPQPMTEVSAML